MDGQGADAAADLALARQLILAACASGNAGALSERLDGVSAALSAELQTEIGAARKTLELLEERQSQAAALDAERAAAAELREQPAAAADERRRGEAEAATSVQQLTSDLAAAKAGAAHAAAAPAAAAGLDTMQLKTRINELESVVVALQTAVRHEEQEKQRVQTELGVAQQTGGAGAAAYAELEARQQRTQRQLEQSERTAAALQQQVKLLEEWQHEHRLNSQRVATELALPAAEGAAGEGTIEEATRALERERGRRQLCEAELLKLKGEAEAQLDRQRKGADRSMRELQGEVARLQARPRAIRRAIRPRNSRNSLTAQFVGAIFRRSPRCFDRRRRRRRARRTTPSTRSSPESGYRERAETGWEAAQQALDGVEAELQETRSKVATLEGKLSAAEGLAASANTLRAQREANAAAQGERAEHDARMGGLIQAEKMAHMRADEALEQARQQAADEVAQLTASTTSGCRRRRRTPITGVSARRRRVEGALAASQLSAARGAWSRCSHASPPPRAWRSSPTSPVPLRVEGAHAGDRGCAEQEGGRGRPTRQGRRRPAPGVAAHCRASPRRTRMCDRGRRPVGCARRRRAGARASVWRRRRRGRPAAPPYRRRRRCPIRRRRRAAATAGRRPTRRPAALRGRAVNGYYAAGAGYGKPPPPVGRPAGGSKIGAPPRRTGDNPRRSDGGVGRRAAAKGSRERDPGSRDVGGRGARAFR